MGGRSLRLLTPVCDFPVGVHCASPHQSVAFYKQAVVSALVNSSLLACADKLIWEDRVLEAASLDERYANIKLITLSKGGGYHQFLPQQYTRECSFFFLLSVTGSGQSFGTSVIMTSCRLYLCFLNC